MRKLLRHVTSFLKEGTRKIYLVRSFLFLKNFSDIFSIKEHISHTKKTFLNMFQAFVVNGKWIIQTITAELVWVIWVQFGSEILSLKENVR